MFLAGPLMCGFTQTINDWCAVAGVSIHPALSRRTTPSCPVQYCFYRYDRDLDAINEPYRPIPSGAISETEVYQQVACDGWNLIGSGWDGSG